MGLYMQSLERGLDVKNSPRFVLDTESAIICEHFV